MARRRDARPQRPPRNLRQQAAQRRTYRRELREVKDSALGYGPEGNALAIFFVMTIVLALMGNGLAIALGGPIFVTPFIYYYLKTGKDPERMVQEMTTAPGEGSMFDLGGRRR